MNELETSIALKLTGNIDTKSRQYASDIDRMAKSSSRSIRVMNNGTRALGNGVDRLGRRYSGMVSGGMFAGAIASMGAGAATKKVMALDERLQYLGVQAGISDEKVEGLNEQIFKTAQQKDIKVDANQLLGSIEEIVEKTGDLNFATENMEALGMAISATGAQGRAIGGIAAEFQKMGISSKKDVKEAFDILVTQGKEGAFTLENLASLGPRVMSAYSATGRGGLQAIREMGAVLQVVRQGTGSSEQAATAFEALLRTLSTADKIKVLRQGGIQVFDPEKMKQGEKVMRPIQELMQDIIARAEADPEVLSKIFDSEAMRAFNASIGEYKRSGALESLQRFYGVQVTGNQLMEDSSRIANRSAGAVRNLSTAWDEFTNKKLAGPMQSLTDWLNETTAEEVQNTFDTAGNVAAGAATAYGAKKAYDAASWMHEGGQKLMGNKEPKSLGSKVLKYGKKAAAPLVAGAAGTAGSVAASAAVVGLGSYYGMKSMLESNYMGKQNFYQSEAGHDIGRIVALVLAALGSETAKESIDKELQAKAQTATLKIGFDQTNQPVITQVETEGFEVDIEGGAGYE